MDVRTIWVGICEIFLEFFVLFDYLLDLQVAMKHRKISAVNFGSCLVFCGFLDFLFRVSFSDVFMSFGIFCDPALGKMLTMRKGWWC